MNFFSKEKQIALQLTQFTTKNQGLEKDVQKLNTDIANLKQESERKKKELEGEIVILKGTIEDLESDKNNIASSKESVNFFLFTHILIYFLSMKMSLRKQNKKIENFNKKF